MRREERRQDEPGPTFPDWCRARGVIIFAMYVSRVRTRVRASYQACGGLGFWRVWYVLRRHIVDMGVSLGFVSFGFRALGLR